MDYDTIVTLCARKGVSVATMCRECGISSASATGWKKGSKISLVNKQRIANYFGVSASVFLEKEPSPAVPVSVVTNDEMRVLSLLRSLTDQEKETIMTMLEALAQKHLTDKRTVG